MKRPPTPRFAITLHHNGRDVVVMTLPHPYGHGVAGIDEARRVARRVVPAGTVFSVSELKEKTNGHR